MKRTTLGNERGERAHGLRVVDGAKGNDQRKEQFVPLPHRLFDLGVAAVIEPSVLVTYLALRRFVWRSSTKGDLRRLFRGGKLVARIFQRKLAAIVGTSRRQTVSDHLDRLVELGWVSKVNIRKGGSLGYVFGERKNGRQVYFLDTWLDDLRREGGDPKGRTPTEQANIARGFIERRSVRSTGHPLDAGANTPMCGAADTKKRERSEREKKENSTSAGEAPPSSFFWRLHLRTARRSDERQDCSRDIDGIFDLYVSCYERRFGRTFAFTSEGRQKIRGDLRKLVRREGLDAARRAVEFIFTPRFKWMNNHANALANPDLYGKHVLPALTEQRDHQQAGREPGQWSGSREGKPRGVSSAEFFGR